MKKTQAEEGPPEEECMPAAIGKIVRQVVARKTEGLDPLDVEEIEAWASDQVRRLINHLNVKIWKKRQKGKPIEVNRLQYVAACEVLGIAESAVGQPVDVEGAKTAKKVLLRTLHPDANGGDASKVERYQQVVVAFDAIESYVKLLSKKPRRPYKKRVKLVA